MNDSPKSVDITDLELMALADGELAEPEASTLRAAIDADPALADRYEIFAGSRRVLASAFAELDRQPLPPRLLAALRGGPASGPAPEPVRVPLAAAPWTRATSRARRRWIPAFAVAASLLGAVGVGYLAGHSRPEAPASSLVAALASQPAALGQALDSLRSGEVAQIDADGSAELMPLASFDNNGVLCREFEASRPGGGGEERVQGVACQGQGQWSLDSLGRDLAAAPAADPAGFAPASGGGGSLMARYPAASPLTPEQEEAAIRSGWKR